MKEHIQKAKEGWANLAMREKRMISVGGTLAAVFVLYQWIWSPYFNMVTEIRERIVTQQKTLVWMEAADADLAKAAHTSNNNAVHTTPIVLLSTMQKKISQAGLTQSMTSLRQTSKDSIEIQFAKVNFDKMIQLLIETLKEQQVAISQMAVSADTNAGSVNATVVLKT